MDQERLYEALRKADAAGDTAAAQRLADYIRETRGQMPQPAAVKAGGMINEIPRQIGLTARYGLEGAANTAQIVSEPIRQLVTDPLARAFTGGTAQPGKPLGQVATGIADWMRLPSPKNANERSVADGARLMAGAGGFMGAASGVSQMAGAAGAKMAAPLLANPAAQLTAAGGGGLASGASREAGGSNLEQFGAAALGTVAGGLAPGAVNSVINKIAQLRTSPMALEGKITLALREVGVDWQSVPANVRQQLMRDVQKATSTGGQMNPDAVRRLADFRMTGTTPTRGMITLDPVQVTREQNLAKIGANTADDGLQGLARTQNQNNAKLIENLNTLGAARGDPMVAGRSSIDAITGIDRSMGERVNSLYTAARNMPGGNTPLQRRDLVNNIYGRLAAENKLAFLPSEVSGMLDDISAGVVKRGGQEFDVPFDAKALDNLMTTIATAQRGTRDGNVKAALNAVRAAIDDTPITPVKTQYGGNQLVTQEGAQFLRDQDAQAPAFMDALNQARGAARERFNWQESARPIEAAISGVEPDKFVQRFVIGGSVRDAAAVAQTGDRAAVRDAIVNHLKNKAVSDAADEVGKFSQSAFNKALKQIGNEKLRLFFGADEIQQLEANARAASYMQFQPPGSAVNNSNSGALMLGAGYDWLNAVAGKIPFGKQAIIDPVRGIDISLSQRQAQNITPGLLMPNQQQPMPWLAGPAAAGLGLLSAPNKP